MDSSLQQFHKTLEMNSIPPDNLPSWVGEILAFATITAENVVEVVRILEHSRSKGAYQSFWQSVIDSPYSDEEWDKIWVIGGEVTMEGQQAYLRSQRSVVEIVRAAVEAGKLTQPELPENEA